MESNESAAVLFLQSTDLKRNLTFFYIESDRSPSQLFPNTAKQSLHLKNGSRICQQYASAAFLS